MLHKISSLAFLGLVAALLAAAPANADLIHEWDADAAPYYWHDVHVDVDKFSAFDHDHFEGANSDLIHPPHNFYSGVPNTAEWIWWLDHSDIKEFSKDPVVATPEPASLFLLGSGVLALVAWRRRAKHSAPIS
jgi:hypothetical protein